MQVFSNNRILKNCKQCIIHLNNPQQQINLIRIIIGAIVKCNLKIEEWDSEQIFEDSTNYIIKRIARQAVIIKF